jgi:hypothetical protein
MLVSIPILMGEDGAPPLEMVVEIGGEGSGFEFGS